MNSPSHTINGFDRSNQRASIDSSLAAPMRIQIIEAHSLCGQVLHRWNRIRDSNPFFKSPYFDAEFTKAVARVRDDVKIATYEENGEIVSFLPFQENSPGHAVPAGGLLNDWHGIMGKKTPAIAQQMLKAAGLNSYKFHASDNTDNALQQYYFREFESHYLDMSEGWDACREWILKNSSTVKRQGQKTRGLGREFGEVRFEFDSQDPNLLEQLIELKRAKYQRSNTFDILGVPWASDLLREIHSTRHPNFRGLLSAYWAGDELVGAHFGMLSNDVLHYWFPVYNPRFHKYSPGTEMLMQSAKHACGLGISKLDLGYGDDAYKFKFCKGHDRVAFGLVSFNPLTHTIEKYRYSLRNQLKNIPMKPLVKKVLRNAFPDFGGWNYR